jgi:hypothetical protein
LTNRNPIEIITPLVKQERKMNVAETELETLYQDYLAEWEDAKERSLSYFGQKQNKIYPHTLARVEKLLSQPLTRFQYQEANRRLAKYNRFTNLVQIKAMSLPDDESERYWRCADRLIEKAWEYEILLFA